MARKKKMTAREKKINAETKKQLQKEGILPPDKPRLNRKKFVEEARKEWAGRDRDCYIWDIYLMEAMSILLSKKEGRGRVSLEAVGVAKALKLAIRMNEFDGMVARREKREYEIGEKYEYIKDILNV